ncbi:MAG: energy-coupling factor transporter ATPase [Firmicutes bacterium HGW-Firmicutes-9]|jgi:energy-coupling factor transport system ATP-binding protein|nr:MAG: energy-coupling factor transporter ATPase [Firmicutes bacterium HGW-Firmicutes-9]
MPIIIEQLSHTYLPGSQLAYPALSDVSLTVQDGEFLGIIGHTGSGKSTLIQHLNGLLLPTAGSVLVDGLDTREKKLRKQIRSLVGMVFQYPEYQLFEETVERDVAFGPKNMGLSEEEIAPRVEEALRLVGLNPSEFSEKSPFELSGGEKRRAALAGILAMRPKYLVLDEPMAGLDPRGRREILALIESLRSDYGTGIVMVSHSMDDVAMFADRIAVLDKGSLFMVASPEDVFSHSTELLEMGLNLPQATQLVRALRARGIDIQHDYFRMEELAADLIGRWNHDR